MTIFQFIASLVGSLAWPVTLVFVVFLFRRPILALLDKMQQFEGWGLKAWFGGAVDQLAADTAMAALPPAAEVAPVVPPPKPPKGKYALRKSPPGSSVDFPPTHMDPIALLPTSQPREIVTYGWQVIDQALRDAGKAHGYVAMTDARLVEFLCEAGKLQPKTAALIENARTIRNRLAHHGGQPDYNEAVLYLTTAQAISQAILREAGAAPRG